MRTVEGGSGNLLKRLREGELDMALLGSVGPLAAKDLQVEQLFARPFTIIAAPQRHIGRDGRTTFANLVGEPFVALGEQYVHAQAFRVLNHSAGVRQRIVFRSDDVNLIKNMVRQDVGIALLTDLAITPEDNLQLIHLTDVDQPLFTVSLVRRQNQLTTPVQRQVISTLIQQQ
ncbi:LysR substrate-binding domain-containing protein [Lacticaseibacillus thailandensis]|uniref:LysR substrate-binding domain-containing protein n=1 Tax=Lacticaseibacillus thailandensis TaxID=381741 RepID=UPI0009EB5E46|nr:LysR substrate-binding domain-containing protein [Lacticaseibacillus thailandensis]